MRESLAETFNVFLSSEDGRRFRDRLDRVRQESSYPDAMHLRSLFQCAFLAGGVAALDMSVKRKEERVGNALNAAFSGMQDRPDADFEDIAVCEAPLPGARQLHDLQALIVARNHWIIVAPESVTGPFSFIVVLESLRYRASSTSVVVEIDVPACEFTAANGSSATTHVVESRMLFYCIRKDLLSVETVHRAADVAGMRYVGGENRVRERDIMAVCDDEGTDGFPGRVSALVEILTWAGDAGGVCMHG